MIAFGANFEYLYPRLYSSIGQIIKSLVYLYTLLRLQFLFDFMKFCTVVRAQQLITSSFPHFAPRFNPGNAFITGRSEQHSNEACGPTVAVNSSNPCFGDTIHPKLRSTITPYLAPKNGNQSIFNRKSCLMRGFQKTTYRKPHIVKVWSQNLTYRKLYSAVVTWLTNDGNNVKAEVVAGDKPGL